MVIKKSISILKNNEHFHKLECKEGNIIFVPNYWLILYKNSGKSECSVENFPIRH